MSDWKPSTQEIDAAERVLFDVEQAMQSEPKREPDGYWRSTAEAVAIAIHEAREPLFDLREGERVRLTSPEGGPPRLYLVGKPNGNHFPLTAIEDGPPLPTLAATTEEATSN